MALSIVKAHELRVGQEVRKQIPHGPRHFVEAVEIPPDRPDVRVVKTNLGTWMFDFDEDVTFPRRPDGSKRDWFREKVVPRVEELCIGDILPPINLHPSKTSIAHMGEDHPLYLNAVRQWENEWVKVASIWADRRDMQLIRMFLKEPASGRTIPTVNAYMIGSNVTPPYEGNAVLPKAPKKRGGNAGPYEAYGPYRVGEDWVFFAVHPYGQGRWPGPLNSQTGVQIGDHVYVRKIVPGLLESNHFMYGGHPQARHPRDPRSGVHPETNPPPYVIECYRAYRDPAERFYEGDEEGLTEFRKRMH